MTSIEFNSHNCYIVYKHCDLMCFNTFFLYVKHLKGNP